MIDIQFSVETEAVPQPRAKVVRMGNMVRMYTPLGPRIAAYKEALIKGLLANCGEDFQPLTGPIHFDVRFVFERSALRMKESHHIIKPDTDNLLKCVMDCLTGTAWKDDAQIYSFSARKEWANTYLGGKSGRKLVSGKSFVDLRIRSPSLN